MLYSIENNSMNGDLNQYKIIVTLAIGSQQFYTNCLVLISPIFGSSICKVEFYCVNFLLSYFLPLSSKEVTYARIPFLSELVDIFIL